MTTPVLGQSTSEAAGVPLVSGHERRRLPINLLFGLGLLGTIGFLTVAAPLLTRYSPNTLDLATPWPHRGMAATCSVPMNWGATCGVDCSTVAESICSLLSLQC